jgi:hypothetical protein
VNCFVWAVLRLGVMIVANVMVVITEENETRILDVDVLVVIVVASTPGS